MIAYLTRQGSMLRRHGQTLQVFEGDKLCQTLFIHLNSVLSFLSTLLFNRLLAAVRMAGLHPGVGYLHQLDYGRYSLVLDLMEEFRSLLVETTTLSLFNLGILKQEDFHYETPPAPAPEPEPSQRPEQVCEDPIGINSQKSLFEVQCDAARKKEILRFLKEREPEGEGESILIYEVCRKCLGKCRCSGNSPGLDFKPYQVL